MCLGLVSDTVSDRRWLLLLSFFGAALSYSMVGVASGVRVLMLSRVVVGMVKQTMTQSKAMAGELASPSSRAAWLGAVGSAATAGWVSGSAATGTVRDFGGPAAPSAVAVAIYAVCAVLVLGGLPAVRPAPKLAPAVPDPAAGGARSLFDSVRAIASDGSMVVVVAIGVIYRVVAGAENAMRITFEMDRFGLNANKLGRVTTFKSVGSILASAMVVGPAIRRAGGEAQAFAIAMGLYVAASVAEASATELSTYMAIAVAPKVAAGLVTNVALDGLRIRAAPPGGLGTMLAAVDVLNSGCGVLAPLVGGAIVSRVQTVTH